MSSSPWVERFRRYGMLLQAPINFARSQPYRKSVFQGMMSGETLIRAGVRRIAAYDPQRLPLDNRRLDVIWENAPPAICILVGGVSGGHLEACAEGFFLAATVSSTGRPVRLMVMDEASGPRELDFRLALEARFGATRAAQGLIEVVDAASKPAPCSAADLFVVADPSCARRLAEAFAEQGASPVVHLLGAADEGTGWSASATALLKDWISHPPGDDLRGLAERLAAALDAKRGGPPATTRSARGLDYRVLKPLAADFVARRTCLFVHYDRGDLIDPYVVRYLEALKACGLDLILVSSSALDGATLAEVEPLLSAAVIRQNSGLDFSGWALALELFPQVLASEEVIIANDSVYGPVGDLSAMMAKMQARSCDLWGVAESLNTARHFQSWFVCFRRAALASPVFQDFWNAVLPLTDKSAIINHYEVPILRVFKAAGLSAAAVVDYAKLSIGLSNPSIHAWQALLNLGAPFVKVQLLRENPADAELGGWTDILAERGYPPSLPLNHLRRTVGRGAAALQTR